jgi:hypothetical protein
VVLLETHCPSAAVADAWMQEGAGPGQPWHGSSFWCMGSSASRGVAVLLGRGFVGQGLRVDFQDEHGRLLRVSWTLPDARRCACLAVYAPVVPEERSQFFAVGGPLHSAVTVGAASRDLLFMAGDFNCALFGADVLHGAGPIGSRGVGASALADLLSNAGLVDVWGSLHSGKLSLANDAYTRVSRVASGDVTGARLDYIMAPAELYDSRRLGAWVQPPQGCCSW